MFWTQREPSSGQMTAALEIWSPPVLESIFAEPNAFLARYQHYGYGACQATTRIESHTR
jgi:hypothetical protein